MLIEAIVITFLVSWNLARGREDVDEPDWGTSDLAGVLALGKLLESQGWHIPGCELPSSLKAPTETFLSAYDPGSLVLQAGRQHEAQLIQREEHGPVLPAELSDIPAKKQSKYCSLRLRQQNVATFRFAGEEPRRPVQRSKPQPQSQAAGNSGEVSLPRILCHTSSIPCLI